MVTSATPQPREKNVHQYHRRASENKECKHHPCHGTSTVNELIIIIGSGPAALTAAIYAARANLAPVVIASSVTPGGDLMNTTEVENYPGFPEGIRGPELMERIQAQAERFGAEVIYEDVISLELHGDVKTVTIGDGTELTAKAVIFATGSAYRKLGLSDEERLSGHGVSWCATCDGFFFKSKTIAVVGGGDSATEEALFLTKFASKVYLIHRGSELRASKVMQDRVRQNPKIEILLNRKVGHIYGEDNVTGLRLDSTLNSDIVSASSVTEIEVTGVFIAIGSDPRTHLVHGQLELNKDGTIAVDGRSSRTNISGVFAAGDVIDGNYRQAVTAAASGTVAALDAEHFLSR
jgi:thioredoxin reductase (NADPH)